MRIHALERSADREYARSERSERSAGEDADARIRKSDGVHSNDCYGDYGGDSGEGRDVDGGDGDGGTATATAIDLATAPALATATAVTMRPRGWPRLRRRQRLW